MEFFEQLFRFFLVAKMVRRTVIVMVIVNFVHNLAIVLFSYRFYRAL